jgi:hypothetical protein
LSTWAAVMEAVPVASSWTVMFWVSTTGATVSATVTVAAAEAELPLLVAALRARGVRVVRADVRRIAAGARRPAGEDVDRGEALR